MVSTSSTTSRMSSMSSTRSTSSTGSLWMIRMFLEEGNWIFYISPSPPQPPWGSLLRQPGPCSAAPLIILWKTTRNQGVRARWFLKFLENQINFLVLIFGKNAQKWYFGCPNVNKKKPFFHQKLPKHVGKTIHNAISFVWLSFLQRFRANFEIRLFYWV